MDRTGARGIQQERAGESRRRGEGRAGKEEISSEQIKHLMAQSGEVYQALNRVSSSQSHSSSMVVASGAYKSVSAPR